MNSIGGGPTCGPDGRQSCRYVGRTELVLWESQIGTTSMRDSRGSYAAVRVWECPVEHRRSGGLRTPVPRAQRALSRHQGHTTHLLRAGPCIPDYRARSMAPAVPTVEDLSSLSR